MPHAVNLFVQAVATHLLPFAEAMAAVGILSMAIIQTVKDIFPVRNTFHKKFIKNWLERNAGKAGEKTDAQKAERHLIKLATAGDEQAFYDLPIEQLCGQINAAAQVILDHPREHADLLRCLAAEADPGALKLLTSAEPASPLSEKRSPDEVNARARAIHQVQRSIDSLQISAGYRWKKMLQIWAFLLSYAFTMCGILLFPGPVLSLRSVILTVGVGLAGGFLAPVARDLVVSLQKLRS